MSQPRAESGARRAQRVTIAISANELTAVHPELRSADGAWRTQLEPPSENNGWSSLAGALAELARALGGAGAVGAQNGSLVVSLMPPLAEVRRLELPPLRADELQRTLTRDASRYFVQARGPQVVGVSLPARRARRARVPVVATSAPARLIAAIRGAAQQTGWTVDAIAPAETAWTAAAFALWPVLARQGGHALVAQDDRTNLLQFDDGRLSGVRRFRAGASDGAMIVDSIGGPSARAGVLGATGPARELSAALASFGLSAARAGDTGSASDRPDVLAARFAGSSVGPALRGEDSVALERAGARKAACIVAAAALVLFAAAAGIQLWGVRHQLAEVRAEREALRPQLAATMVGRTTVDATYKHLLALNQIESTAPRWSSVISTLSQSVPEEAYLTAIRARQDSVIVDGLAGHAARVFDAIERTRGFMDVKSAAPVRRELQEDGPALEHFTIAARVESVKPSPTAPASAARTPPARRSEVPR
ncbi:MAG TPA: PilN domain-containing protein [Gemmatimonadaceae bacterium]|nr:PilN domain-containing protein [Gemmatimonadaceae bacterium]